MRNKPFKKGLSLLEIIFLVIFCAFILIPIIFTISASLMSDGELRFYFGSQSKGYGDAYFHIFPDFVSFENYNRIFVQTPEYLQKFWISIGISVVAVVGQVIISCLGGYALARFDFKLKSTILIFVIVTMLLPTQVTIVSHYIIMEKIGLINSYFAILLPIWISPFGVFLMRQFFITVSKSQMEAAALDGAGELSIFLKIILPQRKNGVASLVILAFIDCWNLVEQPLVFLKDTSKYPMSVLTSTFSQDGLGIVFACGVLALIPVLLLFSYFEDALVEGVSKSAIR